MQAESDQVESNPPAPAAGLFEQAQPWDWLASLEDDRIPLLEAALLIARDEYPGLDVAATLAEMDRITEGLRAVIDPDAEPLVRLRALNRHLFETLGFSGDFLDYYDPRNSYLNEVLARRLGIPITLALVYVELGRRVGVALDGVSFPGHFLVRMEVQGGLIVLDPYHRGKSISAEELKLRARTLAGIEDPDDEALFQLLLPARNRAVLVRMLHNLKALYSEREETLKALRCADRIVLLDPQPADIRDRGLLYHSLGADAAARRDLERYLSLQREADGERHEQVEATLRELQMRPTRLH